MEDARGARRGAISSALSRARVRARRLAERVPDLLQALALIAAAMARLIPSATLASPVDVLLAMLVLATALEIDPRHLLRVRSRWRTILLLAVLPLIALTLVGWALSQLVHGELSDGTLALGLAPAEVASAGLIGLMGGAAELAIAVLAGSLVLSAVAGPPALALLAGTGHGPTCCRCSDASRWWSCFHSRWACWCGARGRSWSGASSSSR